MSARAGENAGEPIEELAVARWVEAIEGALLDRARHELGESLMLDGELVNDPHAQPTRRRP